MGCAMEQDEQKDQFGYIEMRIQNPTTSKLWARMASIDYSMREPHFRADF